MNTRHTNGVAVLLAKLLDLLNLLWELLGESLLQGLGLSGVCADAIEGRGADAGAEG